MSEDDGRDASRDSFKGAGQKIKQQTRLVAGLIAETPGFTTAELRQRTQLSDRSMSRSVCTLVLCGLAEYGPRRECNVTHEKSQTVLPRPGLAEYLATGVLPPKMMTERQRLLNVLAEARDFLAKHSHVDGTAGLRRAVRNCGKIVIKGEDRVGSDD